MEPFRVLVDHLHSLPGRTFVRVLGEIDITAAPRILSVAQVAAACSRDMVLDMAGVTFIDRAGMTGILDAHRALARCGQYLFLRRVPPPVQHVMNLLDLDDAFTIHI
jgi:anti-anti-sigma factor